MAENMMDNGRTIRWKAMACLHGQTAEDMKVNISMIKKKDKVSSIGLMAESTRETGKMGNNTV